MSEGADGAGWNGSPGGAASRALRRRRRFLWLAAAAALVISACAPLDESSAVPSASTLPNLDSQTTDTQALPPPTSTIPGASDLPTPLPPSKLGDDPDLNALAGLCFGGDLASCDTLYDVSPIGSRYEAYADTCGGRNESGFVCADLYNKNTPPVATDLVEQVDDGTWIGVVGSATDIADATDQAAALDSLNARILSTNDYESLAVGFWLVYIAPSSSGPEVAEACEGARARVTELFCVQALASDETLRSVFGPPFGPWTVRVGSFNTDNGEEAYSQAVAVASGLVEASQQLAQERPMTNMRPGVLNSTDHPSLNPGFWMTHFGQFDSQSDATATCNELRKRWAVPDCAARPLATWAQP